MKFEGANENQNLNIYAENALFLHLQKTNVSLFFCIVPNFPVHRRCLCASIALSLASMRALVAKLLAIFQLAISMGLCKLVCVLYFEF
jgi:hypothetical protein